MTTDTELPISPCVKQCGLDATRSHCKTCLRTRDEIIAWGRMTNAERQVIMDQLPARHATTETTP